MAFLQEYKRLDNLCKDLLNSERGISTYIDAMTNTMENYGHISQMISGWEKDYKTLKKYRYIRNRIVHDNNANESDLCEAFDEKWLRNFYARIIEGSDPLTLYDKYQKHERRRKETKMKRESVPYKNTKQFDRKHDNRKNKVGLLISVLSCIIILICFFVCINIYF